MRLTKFNHSCLLAELPAPVNRTVLFDPGVFSSELVRSAALQYLDDIVITHGHSDHFDIGLVQELLQKFPAARVICPAEVAIELQAIGISAGQDTVDDLQLFTAPHEAVEPMGPTPAEIGVHYMDRLTHPGDCHHFTETKAVLALPIVAPWGSTIDAVRLALELKPRYIVPIHDHMWSDEWRLQTYDNLARFFAGHGIQFMQPVDGQSFVLDSL